MDVYEPTPSKRMIVNLPATVEMATPNIYADQIEWFGRNLRNRESIILSLHPTTTGARGSRPPSSPSWPGRSASRGTLFGNGERTGNVDVVTLALNMFTQGWTPSSTSPTSTICGGWRSTATSSPCIPAIPTRASSSTPHSPGRTRTRSRRA